MAVDHDVAQMLKQMVVTSGLSIVMSTQVDVRSRGVDVRSGLSVVTPASVEVTSELFVATTSSQN